jgi:hypothetical protein
MSPASNPKEDHKYIVLTRNFFSRVFWENGYRTVGAIANADPKELVLVLMQVCYLGEMPREML